MYSACSLHRGLNPFHCIKHEALNLIIFCLSEKVLISLSLLGVAKGWGQ